MEQLFISKYNEKLKKIKIDEIETKRNDDSLAKEIYNIAINELPDNICNFSEEEMDEKIEFNKTPLELLLSSSINSNSLSLRSSLRKSSLSSNSDITSASSEFHYKFNENINILESYDNNNSNVSENHKRKIDITNIITGEEKRTMIEINKIQKKFNIKTFKEELNNKGFKGKYDYISFEIIDRYNNDSNINTNYKKVYINFNEPLHIIIFYYLYQKKYFNFKGNINDIQYSDHIPKRDICLESNNNLKNNYNNIKKNISEISKIEIPKEYFDFYKKVNPNDVCICLKDSYFGIDTFIVKKNNNKK
jgi:hypothetical protein